MIRVARPALGCALLISLGLPASAQFSEPVDGAIYFSLGTNAIDAPLFGVDATYAYNIYLRQRFASGEQLSLFGSGGFPSSRQFLTLEASDLRFREGIATVRGGDIGLKPLRPARFSGIAGESTLPLLGLGAEWVKSDRQLQLFTGVNRFAIRLPDSSEIGRSYVADLRWLERFARTHLGAGVTLIADPHYLGDRTERSVDAVVSGRYIRELRPYVHAFSEASVSLSGSGAARAGLAGDFRNGDISTSVYAFGDDMPFLYPLFRPGEIGAEAGGSYRFSEFGSIGGNVNYLQDDPLARGSAFIASAQLGYSFGYDRPFLTLSASHNELVYDNFEEESEARFGDRFALGISRSTLTRRYNLRLEHAEDTLVTRTQLYGGFGREVGREGFVDSYVVLQAADEELGALAEVTVQNRIRRNIWYVAGVGGAWQRTDVERAEGFVTAGLSWRSPRNGWIGRVDLLAPFGVGMPRANRVSRSIRAQVGLRYDWDEVSELRRVFSGVFFRNDFGRIEGRVISGGEPVADAVILVGGIPMASSGSDGRFSASGVPVGQVRVEVDPFSVDPSLVQRAGAVIVNVLPRETTTIEIELARSVAFFGSLVRCDGEELIGIGGATIGLVGDVGIYELSTTVEGGFAASDVTPGVYSIIIDPATIGDIPPDQIPAIEIDLTEDVLGYVIRLGCP